MPRMRPIVWLVAVVALIVGLVIGFEVACQHGPTLAYQGKPVEFWFNQLPMTRSNGRGGVGQSRHMFMRGRSGAVKQYGAWMETPEASAKAIRGMGTNALPLYLGKLARHEGPIERLIDSVARRVGYSGFSFAAVNAEREQAATALILLKPLPPPVVSELVTWSTNRDRQIAAAAHCALVTSENELVTLRSPARKQSLDLDLLNLPMPP